MIPECEELEEEHSASEDDYMDAPIPEPSDRVLRPRSKINYKEPEEDDLFIIEENPSMPSVVMQEPAPARVSYSSRPRKLPQQAAMNPSPSTGSRVIDPAEREASGNSLTAARPVVTEEATPRILKKGDPIPEAFNPGSPAEQPEMRSMELSSVSDHKQHEPISSAYEVGDPGKEPPKPQRDKPVLATPKKSKLKVHIREPQAKPPTPDVPPTTEHAKDTPTTDFKKGEHRSTSESVAGSPGTKTFQKGGGEKARDLEPLQVRDVQIHVDSGKDRPRYSDRIVYMEENFIGQHHRALTSRTAEGELEIQIHRDRTAGSRYSRSEGSGLPYPASIGRIRLDTYYLFVRATQHDNISAEFMRKAIYELRECLTMRQRSQVMFCLADRGRGKNTWDTLYQFIHEAFANTDILVVAATYFETRRPKC